MSESKGGEGKYDGGGGGGGGGGEGKRADGGGAGDESKEDDVPNINVDALDVNPFQALVTDGIQIDMEFTPDRALHDATWEVSYLVDMVGTRKVIILGRTECGDVGAGERAAMKFAVDAIDVSGIKKSKLCNAGLLIASLSDSPAGGGRRELLDVKCVVQVAKNGGKLTRMIMNPLG